MMINGLYRNTANSSLWCNLVIHIAIYGGTFDPIHNGHLNLARAMMEKHPIDEIWFCPVRYSPHKVGKKVSAMEHRYKMVEMAIEGDPKFKVVDFEIKRDGPSYTIDTLEELHEKHPNKRFSLIIGDDSVKGFFKWRDPEKIVRLADLLVGTRHPDEPLDFPKGAHEEVVAAIKKGITETPVVTISATEIRRRLAEGESIEGLVPQKVMDYIITNRLYSP